MSRAQRVQLLVLDLLLGGLSLVAARAFIDGSILAADPGLAVDALILVSWLIALAVHGPYLTDAHASRTRAMLRAAWGLGLATLAALGLARLVGPVPAGDPWRYVGAWLLMLAGVVATRAFLARETWWRAAAPRIIVAGPPDDRTTRLIEDLRVARRCRVAAWLEMDAEDAVEAELDRLADVLQREEITHLVVVADSQRPSFLVSAVEMAHIAGAQIAGLDPFYMHLMQRAPLVNPEDTCRQTLLGRPSSALTRFVHRVNDIVVCLLLAPLALPLVALGALAVKLTSPGPVFFYQLRSGRHQKAFMLYKIRTMVHDESGEFTPTAENDPRITPVGAVLRRLRIDELPQLLCVLTGDMSLIGPRPEIPSRHQMFSDRIKLFDLRKEVAPGITGWAQVNCGYSGDEEEALEKLRYDLYYVYRQSPLLDLRIMLRTLPTILIGHGVR